MDPADDTLPRGLDLVLLAKMNEAADKKKFHSTVELLKNEIGEHALTWVLRLDYGDRQYLLTLLHRNKKALDEFNNPSDSSDRIINKYLIEALEKDLKPV